MLTETDARELDENPIYAGVNFIHSHQYDGFGNHTQHDAPTVVRGTDTPQKISERWTFNEFGQPLSHIDPNGNITTYAYFDGSSSGGDINTKGRFGGYIKSMTHGAKGSADPATNLIYCPKLLCPSPLSFRSQLNLLLQFIAGFLQCIV